MDFRIEALTDFMREIDANVKSVNPKCKTIAEIYPGIEERAVRVGSDVYDMYPVVDTIAHEYSDRRHVGQPHASGVVPGHGRHVFVPRVRGSKAELDAELFVGEGEKIAPGRGHEESRHGAAHGRHQHLGRAGHVMSGSNDIQTRKVIFGWMKENEKTFFLPRQPVRPIGVYFSPKTRNYFAKEFIESYRGCS